MNGTCTKLAYTEKKEQRGRFRSDARHVRVYTWCMSQMRELARMMTLRCTAADVADAATAAKRLGFSSTSEALRALIRFIATADDDVVAWLKARV